MHGGLEQSLWLVLAKSEVDAAVLGHSLFGWLQLVLDELAIFSQLLAWQLVEQSIQVEHLYRGFRFETIHEGWSTKLIKHRVGSGGKTPSNRRFVHSNHRLTL